MEPFSSLRQQISELSDDKREREKGRIMLADSSYFGFLQRLTGSNEAKLKQIESDFRGDSDFFRAFLPSLRELEGLQNAGDLRFHSFTLYACVRALQPRLVVETGVAHGKSSSLILLALSHNGFGNLVSFDLPPNGKLADGSKTALSGREVGWLVPEYLRSYWNLNLRDSVDGLSSMFGARHGTGSDRSRVAPEIDIFFHDSLHTYSHLSAELKIVKETMSSNCLFLADNMEMDSGRGFEDFCVQESLTLEVFGNLGACRRNLLQI